MNIFRGYLKSMGKIPKESLFDELLLPEPPSEGDYVGVLNDNIIQLDFDNTDDKNKVLKIVHDLKLNCDVLETIRGVHLYFKSDSTVDHQYVGVYNALGLHCDIGLGIKNRVIPLRITVDVENQQVVNGEITTYTTKKVIDRTWLQTYDSIEVLPCFFRPINKKNFNLPDCDTRNQTLFTYILTLQTHNFSKEEIRTTIKIINDFILKNPLGEKELNTILRDESFSEAIFFDENNKFYHERFGNYLLTNANILKIDDRLNIYTKTKLYSSDQSEIEKVMIDKIPSLKDAQRKEVYKYMQLKCEKIGEFAHPKYIALKDSVLNIQDMTKVEYNPNLVINNKIEFEYEPSSYNEIMDKTINKVCGNDKDLRKLFEEMIGYTLYRKNTMQSCFILTGEGANGKSTMLNCIKKLIGKSNYTSLDLRELEDTFKPAELYNKLANIGDDISAKYLENSSVFKKVVSGEAFMVSRKYQDPFMMECYATPIFCANELPQVHDKTDGFARRIIIIPFNAKFTASDVDYDPFIEDKLLSEEAITYLLKLAIDGLRRVLLTKTFSNSISSTNEKDSYMRLNNNVLEWFEYLPKIENETVNDTYLLYQIWCNQSGCQPVKKLNFSKEIKKRFGFISQIKTIDGKSIRVYGK